MASTVHEYQVAMTCDGCANAVKKILGKLEGQGVNKVDVDVAAQRVYVDSTLSSDALLEAIKKCGKETTYIGVKSS
ncbi:ATX1 antioxidant protein 1 [Chamberlinius hualienensis]